RRRRRPSGPGGDAPPSRTRRAGDRVRACPWVRRGTLRRRLSGARTPLGDYLRFQPLWNRVLDGERDVTWPGRPHYWVKTSGTTAGDKMIPVTPEALHAHRKGGWDALLVAAERVDAEQLLGGPLLFLGGCTALAPTGKGSWIGDLSGLVVRDLPPGVRGRYSPGRAIS